MIENLTHAGVVQGPLFAVHASPPWLLHLSGELDLDCGPALTVTLQRPTRRSGTVGLDLSELTFMDSTGIHAIMETVRLLGEFGRIVLFNPSPIIRHLIEICGLVGIIDINDDLSPAHHLDRPNAGWAPPRQGVERSSVARYNQTVPTALCHDGAGTVAFGDADA
jgi:anti-anti-sigma factor